MIGRSDEYEKMYRLEGQLWWYRILHERVDAVLRRHFGTQRDIQLLDAGCGTGGLLRFLQQRGYTRLRGIDGSADAVAFCQARDLPVVFLNLNHLDQFEPETTYDVIVCNDVFCYFDDTNLIPLVNQLVRRLRPNGILITNNNAFNVFRGQHDRAVGSMRRFVQKDLEQLLIPAGLQIRTATYWSLLLSPLILLMRQWQDWQLRRGWRALEEAESDVYMPPAWLNETLYRIVRAEQTVFARTPFGSSLFITAGK
ncbi:class I SAM-dependent DNA methyltransferase [Spirosoma rigui]|uniref:class I SAM-dependent DNA methyltransferase n=1 Tax=Spirosoma rigui TaxID=564064 RepID=UPI0009B035B8|nr:class I SAM-dependent methyltransferase [Spirosoma rigui]